MASLDWREGIAEAARPTLEANGVGGVIVGLTTRGEPDYVSRFYSHADPAKLRAILWGRWARVSNDDALGCNYYVVNRYEDGTIIVWNGMHSILWEPDELPCYCGQSTCARCGMG